MTYQQLGRKVCEGKVSSFIFEHAWIQLLLLTAEYIWGQISQSSQMSSCGGCLVWEIMPFKKKIMLFDHVNNKKERVSSFRSMETKTKEIMAVNVK